nr:MAG: hypothetical protein [Wufeng shrew rhabdovirus 3]
MAYRLEKNRKEMDSFGFSEGAFSIDDSHGKEMMEKERMFGDNAYKPPLPDKPVIAPKVITEKPKISKIEFPEVDKAIAAISPAVNFLPKSDFDLLKIKATQCLGGPLSYVDGFALGAMCAERALRKQSQEGLQASFESSLTQLRKEIKRILDTSECIVKASDLIPKAVTKLGEAQVKLDMSITDLGYQVKDLENEAKKIKCITDRQQTSTISSISSNEDQKELESSGNLDNKKMLMSYMISNQMSEDVAIYLSDKMHNDGVMANRYLNNPDGEQQLFELIMAFASKM